MVKQISFLHGLIEYELNSLLGASHLVDYISVHIRFDLERCLLITVSDAVSVTIIIIIHTGWLLGKEYIFNCRTLEQYLYFLF